MSRQGTATYRNVAILRPGAFTDMYGRRVEFSATDLAALAEVYDPDYSAAAVNLDHREHGPALGVVGDLVWDGEFLRAGIHARGLSTLTTADTWTVDLEWLAIEQWCA